MMLQIDRKNLVVIDVETSGINPFIHEVLSIAFVPFNLNLPKKIIHVHHQNIKWGDFAKENFKKFSIEWHRDAITPEMACSEIEIYLKETFNNQTATAIGHNIGFDISFLRKLAYQGKRDQLSGLSHRALDTHTLLYLLTLEEKIPESAVTSEAAFDYFNIFVSEENRHTAIGDAEATNILFRKILEKLQNN